MYPCLSFYLAVLLVASLAFYPWGVEAACPEPIWLPLSNCVIESANTPTVNSWGAQLTVGSPRGELCLVPSTVVNNTILMGTDICRPDNNPNSTIEQCRSRRGNLFNVAAAGTSFAPLPTSSLVQDSGWALIMAPFEPFQQAGKTTLNMRLDASVNMPVAVVTSGNNHTTHEAGLGLNSVLLESLLDAGLIAVRAFGLNAGSQSAARPRAGSLTLGGYDQASVDGPFVDYPMDYALHESIVTRVCPIQVKIRRLTLRLAGREDIVLSDEGSAIDSCIEPYDNLFRLPRTQLDLFKQHTGWTSRTLADPDMFVTEPGLRFPSSTGFNGSLLILLNNDLEVEIPNYELQHPLSGIGANGTRISNDNITEVNVYQDSAPLQAAVLGKVFLSAVYLAVDYDAKLFKLARQTLRDVTPDPTHLTPCSSRKLGGAAIGAIVVGILLGLLGLMVLAMGFRLRKRTNEVDHRVETLAQDILRRIGAQPNSQLSSVTPVPQQIHSTNHSHM